MMRRSRLAPGACPPTRAHAWWLALLLGWLLAETVAAAPASLDDRLLSRDESVRRAALQELDRLDNASRARMVPALVNALEAGHSATIEALARIGTPAAPPLVTVARTGNREPRLLAIQALGRIGPGAPGVLPVIIEALQGSDGIVRLVAADALGLIGPGDGQVVPALIRAMDDHSGDSLLRMRAAMAVGRIGPRATEAIPALVTLLGDPSSIVRKEAAQALGAIGPQALPAVPSLVRGLADREAFVRSAAGDALVPIGPAVAPALVAASRDRDMYVRIQAVRALAELGPVSPDVVPALIRALQDGNSEVRGHAADGLRKLPAPDNRVKAALRRHGQTPGVASHRPSPEVDGRRLRAPGETLAPIPADQDHKYPLALAHVLHVTTSGREFQVTLHRGTDRSDLLRIWTRTDRGYRLLEVLEGEEGGNLEPATVFHRGGEAFLLVTRLYSGTGHYREDAVFWCAADGTARRIPFESAPEAYQAQLKPGETVRKGEQSAFSDDRMTFEFYIWRDRDGNCCPHAGRVTGTYRMTGQSRYDSRTKRAVADFRIVPEAFRREDVAE